RCDGRQDAVEKHGLIVDCRSQIAEVSGDWINIGVFGELPEFAERVGELGKQRVLVLHWLTMLKDADLQHFSPRAIAVTRAHSPRHVVAPLSPLRRHGRPRGW